MTDRPPLDGVLVADFSRVLAGPLATMTLADLGASVVKVERPGRGDDTRAWGPPWSEHGSSYFASVNRTKASITLDLQDPQDLAAARELARRADVLVENFRTGTMERLGLGYDAVAASNPGLVYCSVTGFGSSGGADLPGYDFVVQAVGGLMSITGRPEGDPTKVGVALVDVLTGKDAVIAILAALREREGSGLGQHVEVNLLSSLLGSLVNQAAAYLTTGQAPTRMGNEHPSIAPYETVRCADGLIALACGNDAQFARIADVLGRPALAEHPQLRTTQAARRPHRRTAQRGRAETTASGLVIPDTAKEKPQQGEVIAVGPGRWSDTNGQPQPLDIKVGDTVSTASTAAPRSPVDGEGRLAVILTSRDVLADRREVSH
jgi:crotonobetainyl-CoA:carnitine CoA-transferase CaiB-like acyl-CoA transferase